MTDNPVILLLWGLIGAVIGFLVGYLGGTYLLLFWQTGSLEGDPQELAMIGFFLVGPAGGVIGLLLGVLLAKHFPRR